MLLYRGATSIRACLSDVPRGFHATRHQDCAWIIANVLHNLAYFSALEFEGFDEARYWEGATAAARFHPLLRSWGDRAAFERGIVDGEHVLADAKAETAPARRLYHGKFELIRGGADERP